MRNALEIKAELSSLFYKYTLRVPSPCMSYVLLIVVYDLNSLQISFKSRMGNDFYIVTVKLYLKLFG